MCLFINKKSILVIGQFQFSNDDTRPLETRSNIIALPRVQSFIFICHCPMDFFVFRQ